MNNVDAESFYIGGNASDISFLASLLGSRGVPSNMVAGSNWLMGQSHIAIPGSHAHLAHKILREYTEKNFQIITPEQYAKNRKRLLVFLVLIAFLAIGI